MLRITWKQVAKLIEMSNRFYYCQSAIEMNHVCRKQCSHCRAYYKPLEDKLKRTPRKKKKRAAKNQLTYSEAVELDKHNYMIK